MYSKNNFSHLDADVTNVASYCVYVAPGATRVIGDIGAADPTSARAITNAVPGAGPWTVLSMTGAVVQGSGNDILTLRNSKAATVTTVTEDGSLLHTGGNARFSHQVEADGGVLVNGMRGATATPTTRPRRWSGTAALPAC